MNSVLKELEAFPLWKLKENKATRQLKFENYLSTVSFVNAVAYLAEKMNHHPDISFGYNTLEISYQTHDAGNQLTHKDLQAIASVEGLLQENHK